MLAFFESDPYYPLPLGGMDMEKQLWSVFRSEYLQRSEDILKGGGKDERLRELPIRFINACVAREQDKLSRGLGHGHRDLKG